MGKLTEVQRGKQREKQAESEQDHCRYSRDTTTPTAQEMRERTGEQATKKKHDQRLTHLRLAFQVRNSDKRSRRIPEGRPATRKSREAHPSATDRKPVVSLA
ncbi:hypothetical protein GCM10009872_55740 [Actinopolymorpha rutila]